MISDIIENQLENERYADEMISIRAFCTSEALKRAIRKMISDYSKIGWELESISVQGPFVDLKFKQRSYEDIRWQ